MSLNWDDEEEELTVTEELAPGGAPAPGEAPAPNGTRPRPEVSKGDETVAYLRKSDLKPEEKKRPRWEETTPLPSKPSFYPQRYPLHAALPRDRFAAFFVDTMILAYANLLLGRLLKTFLFTQPWFVQSFDTWQWPARMTALFLFALLYYVFFEAIAGATPGKFLCRLRVVDLEGNIPPLANIFLRNICRLFDYPLLFLVAVLSMEASPFYQRLGDRAAHTVVIKKTRKRLSPVDLRSSTLSSTFVRMLSFTLDLALFGLFVWLYGSCLNPEKPTAFQWLYWLFPFFAGGYFMIFEFTTSTTPGKFLLKRQAVLENGEPLDASAAILRNLVLPLDLILGYPLLALTRRKQRLGDLLADTLVIKKKGNRNGLISLTCLLMIFLALGYISSHNPNRKWFSEQAKAWWQWSFAKKGGTPSAAFPTPAVPKTAPSPGFPAIPPPSPIPAPAPVGPSIPPPVSPKPGSKAKPQTTSAALKITEFYFSAGPDPTQIRSDGVFRRGDLIFTFFKLAGFQRNNTGAISLVENVMLEDAGGNLILDKNGVVAFSQNVPPGTQNLLFANQLTLPSEAAPGVYRLTLILKDNLTQQQLVFEKMFTLQ